MDASPPAPCRPPPEPPLFLSRSRSTSKTDRKPSSGTASTMTISRLPSNASSRSRAHSPLLDRGASPTNKHPSSAPSTWRAKFASANPLRRKTVAMTSPKTAMNDTPERWSAGSTKSAQSGHSHLSQRSSFSYDVDSVEILKAEIVELVRAPAKPKIVNARSPITISTSQQDGSEGSRGNGSRGERKLLEYWGVRQSDREVVARQRASGGRASAFTEEFEPRSGRSSVTAVGEGDGGDEKALPFPPREQSLGKGREGLSEGLVKWFRCDIFPSNAQDFHAAESEAKRLVVDGSGKLMEQWTYPGGFMFRIPRNLASPLPPSIPSATPTPEEAVLAVHLGPNGSLRVTEFQPHLEPMEHLLHLASASAHAQRSNRISQATTSADPSTSDDEDTGDLVSAIEYLTQPESESGYEVEEIPLLRTTPTKSKSKFSSTRRASTTTSASTSSTQQSHPRESFSDPFALSPVAKSKLHAWLGKQQGGATAKKRRGGQVYELPGSSTRSPRAALKKIVEEEVEVVEESELLGEDDGEWVSDDGDDEGDGGEIKVGPFSDNGSDAGSEFSIATGLDSVKFVAECGSLF